MEKDFDEQVENSMWKSGRWKKTDEQVENSLWKVEKDFDKQ